MSFLDARVRQLYCVPGTALSNGNRSLTWIKYGFIPQEVPSFSYTWMHVKTTTTTIFKQLQKNWVIQKEELQIKNLCKFLLPHEVKRDFLQHTLFESSGSQTFLSCNIKRFLKCTVSLNYYCLKKWEKVYKIHTFLYPFLLLTWGLLTYPSLMCVCRQRVPSGRQKPLCIPAMI